jgi:hypothetical protein
MPGGGTLGRVGERAGARMGPRRGVSHWTGGVPRGRETAGKSHGRGAMATGRVPSCTPRRDGLASALRPWAGRAPCAGRGRDTGAERCPGQAGDGQPHRRGGRARHSHGNRGWDRERREEEKGVARERRERRTHRAGRGGGGAGTGLFRSATGWRGEGSGLHEEEGVVREGRGRKKEAVWRGGWRVGPTRAWRRAGDGGCAHALGATCGGFGWLAHRGANPAQGGGGAAGGLAGPRGGERGAGRGWLGRRADWAEGEGGGEMGCAQKPAQGERGSFLFSPNLLLSAYFVESSKYSQGKLMRGSA